MPKSPDNAGSVAATGNIHGRRAGRGIRPYLIVGKLLSVSLIIGGLASLCATQWLQPESNDAAGWAQRVQAVHMAYSRVIIPGFAGALVFGALLASTMLPVLLRMRWFVVKLALLMVCVPTLHGLTRSWLSATRVALMQEPPDLNVVADLDARLMWGTLAALLLAVAVMILGRIKPRLGQDYGRTFARSREA